MLVIFLKLIVQLWFCTQFLVARFLQAALVIFLKLIKVREGISRHGPSFQFLTPVLLAC